MRAATDLDDLPERELGVERMQAIRDAVINAAVAQPARRPHTRVWVGAGVAGALVLAGGGTAAAVIAANRTAPHSDNVLCYSNPQAGSSSDFPGTTVSLGSRTGQKVTISNAVSACSLPWRYGELKVGSSKVPAKINAKGTDRVPKLTACVRDDGAVAVMPGSADICARMSMSKFAGYVN